MITPTYSTEAELLKTFRNIAGIDEVGRGPLAGPVVAAVVILNPQKIGNRRSGGKWWAGVRDSKILSPRRRGSIAEFIKDNALDFAFGAASHQEIDDFNIHHASLLAMKRAIESLRISPEIILIDGKFEVPLPQSLPRGEGKKIIKFPSLDGRGLGRVKEIQQYAIIDGDAKVLSIAAASILAKVYRDQLMNEYAQKFPQYGFEKHKGYDTRFHRNQLFKYGPCSIHRMNFETVKEVINKRFEKMLQY